MAAAARAAPTWAIKNTVLLRRCAPCPPRAWSAVEQRLAGSEHYLELEHGGGGHIGRNRPWERLLAYCQNHHAGRQTAHPGPDVRDMLAEIYIKGEVTRLFGLAQFLADVREAAKVVRGPQLSCTARWPASG